MSKPVCYSTKAFAAASASSRLAATTIERRSPTSTDVQIEILYCGVCHSDLHFAATNGTSPSIPPCRATRSSAA
jgi:uncharacterized zinc-type alcohol dehydrogenase-like protein